MSSYLKYVPLIQRAAYNFQVHLIEIQTPHGLENLRQALMDEWAAITNMKVIYVGFVIKHFQ